MSFTRPAFQYSTGDATDLSFAKIKNPAFSFLPDPPGIHFHKQGMQMLDFQQQHVTPLHVALMSGATQINPLPLAHFTGPSAYHPNVPRFLSVNEGGIWED